MAKIAILVALMALVAVTIAQGVRPAGPGAGIGARPGVVPAAPKKDGDLQTASSFYGLGGYGGYGLGYGYGGYGYGFPYGGFYGGGYYGHPYGYGYGFYG